MVPETAVAMLACTRIGAVHSVVFGGFAANELAVRIDDSEPKVVVTADCGLERDRCIPYVRPERSDNKIGTSPSNKHDQHLSLVASLLASPIIPTLFAIRFAHLRLSQMPNIDASLDLIKCSTPKVVVLRRPEAEARGIDYKLKSGRDHDFQELVDSGPLTDPVWLKSSDPLYTIYTSGTTGDPKGVLRDNSHSVHLKYSMDSYYCIDPGETFAAFSDVGWVVGHSYIVYAPLIQGCTSVLFEGKPVGTPDAGVYWDVIQKYNVASMFTAPTALRAIRKEGEGGRRLKRRKAGAKEGWSEGRL